MAISYRFVLVLLLGGCAADRTKSAAYPGQARDQIERRINEIINGLPGTRGGGFG